MLNIWSLEMTLTEKQAWASLAAALLVLGYLIANMTNGWSVPDQTARHLWRTWLCVIGFGVFAQIVINQFASTLRKRGALEDERDASIIARADRIGLMACFVAINVLVWQLLMQATWQPLPSPTGGTFQIAPDLMHLPTLMFVLIAVMSLCEIIKQVATIILGRL
jgi:hypothetical protein